MPSVLKSCLRKLTSFPLFPSLHGDDGHVTATAEPLHGPSFREACCRHFVQSLEPSASSKSLTGLQYSSITTDKTQKNGWPWWFYMILPGLLPNCFWWTNRKNLPCFPTVASCCLELCVKSGCPKLIMKRYEKLYLSCPHVPTFRRVLEIGQCCPELNVIQCTPVRSDRMWQDSMG